MDGLTAIVTCWEAVMMGLQVIERCWKAIGIWCYCIMMGVNSDGLDVIVTCLGAAGMARKEIVALGAI